MSTTKFVAKLSVCFLCLIAISANALLAAPFQGIDPPVKKTAALAAEDWKVFVGTDEITIYYLEVKGKERSCVKYRLKIVNNSAEPKTIAFALKGGLTRECLHVADMGFRTISIGANQTLTGDETLPSLLIPITSENLNMEDLIQNLTIQ